MFDQNFFNRIQWIEFVLQLATLDWALEDVSNSQLLEEIQQQNENYLDVIIRQNEQILKKLAELG